MDELDLDAVSPDHPAQKQALADLLARFEQDTDVVDPDQAVINRAQEEEAKDLGW